MTMVTDAGYVQQQRFVLDNWLVPTSAYVAAIPSMSVPLFEHQRRSLQFMIDHETRSVRDLAGVHESFHGIRREATTSQIPGHKKGGILADALGLGKTVTSLALVAVRPAPTLIVCTPSVLGQWEREIAHKTSLEFETFDPKKPLPAKDLVLVTYSTLTRHATPEFLGRFVRVILDEAHTMSNPFVHKVAKDFEIVWCLSATPLKNLDRQLAALLGPKEFDMSDSTGKVTATWLLYCLTCRHTHHSATALPAVEECTAAVALNSEELQKYAKSLESVKASISSGHRRICLSVLTHTRRYLSSGVWNPLGDREGVGTEEAPEDDVCPVCIDVYQDPVATQCKHWFCRECLGLVRRRTARCPMCRQGIGRITPAKRSTVDDEGEEEDPEEPSFKEGSKALAALAHLGTKTIIFSEFRSTLQNMRAVLAQNGIGAGLVLGNATAARRAKAFQEFQTDPECHVLLLTTRATSAGVSLPAANTVIFMEPCLDAHAHEQAIGRAVRLGNVASTVKVVNLVAENTIEEDISAFVTEHRKGPTQEAIKNFLGI